MKRTLKKSLAIILAAMMLICSVPLAGLADIDLPDIGTLFVPKAEAATSGYYTYTVLDGNATIVNVDYSISGDIIIPSSLGGYPVTDIGYDAFRDHDGITSVTIPNSVTNIVDGAFGGCNGLTHITVDNYNLNYSSDSYGVLFNKNKTELLQYPTGNPRTTYVIPDSVTSIDDLAFSGCCSLRSVTIPYSVTSIGHSAFSIYTELTSITVDNNNPNYSNDTYGVLFNKNKTELLQYPTGNPRTTYVIPDSVTSIGYGAFSDCYNLTNIIIPDSVTSIGCFAFSDCGLTSISIPDSVTSIGKNAFSCSYSLTEVIIPNSVTIIEECAFSSCGLTEVIIPDSVTIIEDRAFDDCRALISITVENNNPNYSNDTYGVLFNKNKTKLIQYPAGNKRTSYTIPDGVISINPYAFTGCEGLSRVTIPNSMTRIGVYAFNYCLSLTSITIPNSMTRIGVYAFSHCLSLTSITIPKNVTSIDYGAFICCDSLTNVYYSGTESEWSAISIGLNNECLTDATIHFNSSGNNNETEEYKHMTLGVHNNSFGHTHENFDNFGIDDDMFNYLCDIERSNGYSDNINDLQKDKDNLTYNWNGSCTGFAATMSLVYKNKLSLQNLGVSESEFYSLKSPKTPGYKLIGDAINYYYLTANTKTASKNLKSDGAEFLTFDERLMGNDKTKAVLSKMVSLAKNAEQNGDAFIVGFEVSKHSGFIESWNQMLFSKKPEHITHAIVCVGYNGLVKDGLKKYHSIRLIDTNYPSDYTTFFIDENFNDWHIAKGEYAEYEYWCKISYILLDSYDVFDLDGKNNEINWSSKPSSSLSKNSTDSIQTSSYSSRNNIATIKLIKYFPVNIVNEKGETLFFDGLNFSGTMPIYDTFPFDNGYYNGYCVETELSNLYTLTTEESLFFSLSANGNYYSADLLGSKKAVISVGDNMALSGKEMEGTCYISVDSIETDMISCSITKSDEINMTQTNSNIVINTDDNSSQIKYFKDADVKSLYMESDDGVYEVEDYSKDSCYSVVWNVDGIETKHTYEIGSAIVKPIDPEKNGYTFIGWIPEIPDVMPAENLTFTAVFEEVSVHEHFYTSTTTPATCTEDGVMIYTCECGESYTESIPATGHTQGSWVVSIESSCTEDGEKVARCTECGVVVANDIIPATGHTPGEWITVIEPTTETYGKKIKKCTVCGDTAEETSIEILPKVFISNATITEGTCAYSETITVVADQIDGKIFSHWNVTNASVEDMYSPETTMQIELGDIIITAEYKDCDCNCHKGGITAFFFKIILFFQKLFGMASDCVCGAKH